MGNSLFSSLQQAMPRWTKGKTGKSNNGGQGTGLWVMAKHSQTHNRCFVPLSTEVPAPISQKNN
jgi:hypothetical protein